MSLAFVMTVVALMAAGAHVLAITTPALAEQARQSSAAEAAAQRASVPDATAAASDGLPVPALAGGIVLAFAVGLTAGQVHRRRRRSTPRPSPAARRVTADAPPAGPAPLPPPVARPEAVAVAPPPPAPAPPEPRPAQRRVVLPPPTRPPPEPPRLAPMPVELFEPAPQPLPDAHAPRGEAPEVPRPQDLDRGSRERVTRPLGRAPKALRPEHPSVPARAPAPDPRPGRVAHVAPWPEEAARLWTCEITWKAGYRRSSFRAVAGPPGAARQHQIGESPPLRWTLMSDPEPPTPEFVAHVRALVHALEAAGWERIGRGGRWYAQRFLWRGSGEPGPILILATAQAAEPPSG